jgi:alkyl hydroperoxide reductase subunit AhpC
VRETLTSTAGSVGKDLRYGLRQLARSPGFTTVALLSLALGIGANTAMFQLVDAIRLRALPARDPAALAFASRASWINDWRRLLSRTRARSQEALPMTLRIGDTAPDFEAETTEGPIRFHDWIGNSWAVLFSHPKDFTPVCTTEVGYMAKLKPEFDKRNTKIIGLSVDPVDSHAKWAQDIKDTQGHAPNYPMIGDPELKVAKAWGMLPAELLGTAQGRTPADNQTVRNVFVVGPDKKIKLILVYPMTTGRNFDEVVRVIDSLQLTSKHKVATPVNWKNGEDVIIAGSVSDDDAKKQYPAGWKAPRPYLRIVPQPK